MEYTSTRQIDSADQGLSSKLDVEGQSLSYTTLRLYSPIHFIN